MTNLFDEALNKLNAEQRKAVETLEGPVLVVAGPGTGKTQLLSLRVVNILQSKDVSPNNILCLTFTNAGADAMRERLASFIGRKAYEVTIETFHSFAQNLRTTYPEYYERGAFDKPITSLESVKLVNSLLKALPVTDPLYQNPFEGVSGNVRAVQALIGKIKKSGLSPKNILALCTQNEAFFDYFEGEKADLLQGMAANLQRGAKAQKIELLDTLKTELLLALDELPPELTQQLVTLTGSYEPYALMLRRVVAQTDFYDEGGKTTGFREEVRNRFFRGSPLEFKDRQANAATCSVVWLYQRYQEHLTGNALYDFDDMILDTDVALERYPEFAAALRAQYSYILIDEFQDTNGAQMKIIECIVSGVTQPNILAVGDDDQAIMRFQGASVEFINQFEHKYENTQSIVLKKNYRSVPHIVEFGQEIATQIEGRLATSKDSKHLEAFRQSKGALEFAPHMYAAAELQYFEVVRQIKALIDGGCMENSEHPGSEIAVIARRHKSLRSLIPHLEHHGVAFEYRVRREVSQIASLQTLFALMRFAVYWASGSQKRAEAELPRIIASPEYGVEQRHYLKLACEARTLGSWLHALEVSVEPTLKELFLTLCTFATQAVALPVREALLLLAEESMAYFEAHKQTEPYAVIEFNYGLKALLEFAQAEVDANSPKRRAALGLHGPLSLATVVELLEQSELFGVEVSATIPVANKNAITLTTAHNSKGLEYDWVFLIDADRGNWRGSAAGAKLIAQNIYLSEAEDTDDFRRLLFVAATRARDELKISLAGAHLVPELVDISEPVKITIEPEEIDVVAPLSWQDAYLPRSGSLAQIASDLMQKRSLSVSLLNAFVDYKNNSLDGASFLTGKLMSLPQKPVLASDFGNVVHSYLAGYLNEVLKARTKTEAELVLEARDALAALDHHEADLAHLNQRFDLFLEHFMPRFKPRLDTSAHAELSLTVMLEDVPLTGRIDLLLQENDTSTLAIFDYKTGEAKSPQKQGAGYKRQLQFYKLLLENSPEFDGWQVRGGADIFVEPNRKSNLALAPEEFVYVSEDELLHLRCLIQAVWHRLQHNLFDTSAFMQSEHLQALRASSVYKSTSSEHTKGDPKEPSADEYQSTYELWLIDEHLKASAR